MLRWHIQAVGLQMAHEASCTRGKAARWQSLLFKLVFHTAHIVTGALWEQEFVFRKFQNATKKLCPAKLHSCWEGGVLGRTKSAAWHSRRSRIAGVQLGCMDHYWLTLILQKFTVILKINGPSNWFDEISTAIIHLCEEVSLVLFHFHSSFSVATFLLLLLSLCRDP